MMKHKLLLIFVPLFLIICLISCDNKTRNKILGTDKPDNEFSIVHNPEFAVQVDNLEALSVEIYEIYGLHFDDGIVITTNTPTLLTASSTSYQPQFLIREKSTNKICFKNLSDSEWTFTSTHPEVLKHNENQFGVENLNNEESATCSIGISFKGLSKIFIFVLKSNENKPPATKSPSDISMENLLTRLKSGSYSTWTDSRLYVGSISNNGTTSQSHYLVFNFMNTSLVKISLRSTISGSASIITEQIAQFSMKKLNDFQFEITFEESPYYLAETRYYPHNVTGTKMLVDVDSAGKPRRLSFPNFNNPFSTDSYPSDNSTGLFNGTGSSMDGRTPTLITSLAFDVINPW